MSFAENLRFIRKERNMSQEDLAELLGVSRQAVSKWESDNGYPETEKLLMISQKLSVSMDYLFCDEMEIHSSTDEPRNAVYAPDAKISIKGYDGSIVSCQSVRYSEVVAPAKGTPRFTLSGVDGVGLLGPHTVILGFYEQKEAVQKEMDAIFEAINHQTTTYELKYSSEVELKGFLAIPKLKNSSMTAFVKAKKRSKT